MLGPMPYSQDIPAALLESPSFQLDRLRRRTREEVELALQPDNTTLREYWVMTCLADRDAASQTSLCELLAIDASDMVRIIDALEERGWAKRERDPRDRRRQIITLSAAGRHKRVELNRLVSNAEDRALDESTQKQLKHLRKLAAAIIASEEEDQHSHSAKQEQ